MNRHAYLIIAHNNFYILEKIISLLDKEYNDFYVHIDKKVKEFDFDYFMKLPKKSKIYFVNRIDVRWGDISQIKAEMILFKKAYNESITRNYSFYHLLSGVDMPIKSAKKIYEFYENSGQDFIGYIPIENASSLRYKNYNILTRYFKSKNKILDLTCNIIRYSFIALQIIFKYNRTKRINIKFGPNWVDLRNETVKYLLSKEEYIYKTFSHMRCPDEFYKQTLIFENESLYKQIYKEKDAYVQCKRLIDWKRGRPYIWREKDFDEIIKSDRMFARKFDIQIDKNIVDKIYQQIQTIDLE